MAYMIGTITKASGKWAHERFLEAFKDACVSFGGYTVMRFVNTGANFEVILKCTGYTGAEEFYVGMKTFTDSTTINGQYANIAILTATGYVSGNSFESQTNGKVKFVRANANAFDYVVSISKQRFAGCFFTKNKYSQPFYAGKFYSYSPAYSMPLFVGGSLPSATYGIPLATSGVEQENSPFDTVQQNSGTYQQACSVLDGSATWIDHRLLTFPNTSTVNGSNHLNFFPRQIPLNNFMMLEPCVVSAAITTINPVSFYGELEGIYGIPTYGNEAFNVVQVGGTSTASIDGLTVSAAVAAILAVGGRAFFVMQHHSNGNNLNYTTPLVALEIAA